MRVTMNGAAVYAFATTSGDGYLVCVSADEWEHLGSVPGQQVRVEASRQEPKVLLLAAAEMLPPVVRLKLERFAARRAE